MFDAANWWLKRGVYGYRLDAVDWMFERTGLKDNIVLPGIDSFGLSNQSRVNDNSLSEVQIELRELRAQVIDRYPGRILIGETWANGTAELVQYYGRRTANSSCQCISVRRASRRSVWRIRGKLQRAFAR